MNKKQEPPIWLSPEGKRVSCVEKIKVMEQNLEELQQIATDAFEDGILMGIDPKQLKEYLIKLMQELNNPYK